jgi:hypothetical protein
MACIYKLQQKFHLAWEMCLKTFDELLDNELRIRIFQYVLKAYNDNLKNRKQFLDYLMIYLPSTYDIIVESYAHIVQLAICNKDCDFATDSLHKLGEIEYKFGECIPNRKWHYYSNLQRLWKQLDGLCKAKDDFNLAAKCLEKRYDDSSFLTTPESYNCLITARDITLFHGKISDENTHLAIKWHKKFILRVREELCIKKGFNSLKSFDLVIDDDAQSESWYEVFLERLKYQLRLKVRKGNINITDDLLIGVSYHNIAKLCKTSDEKNEYYRKSFMAYVRCELVQLLFDSKRVHSLKDLHRILIKKKKRLEINRQNYSKTYLESMMVPWESLEIHNTINDSIQLIQIDHDVNPFNVIITIKKKLNSSSENDV